MKINVWLKLIGLNLGLISFILTPRAIGYSVVPGDYEALIRKAVKNTYTEGILKYELKYRSLSSEGDTVTTESTITAINSKRRIDFTAIHSDSLMIVYFDNQLLYVYLSTNTYMKVEVKQRNIEDYVDIVFLPLLQRNFEQALFSGRTRTEKVIESDESYTFKVVIGTKDIGDFFFFITISKLSNTVIKYSYSASVFSVAIWEEYDLIGIEELDKYEAESSVQMSYLEVLSNFKLRTDKSPNDNIDSMLIEFNLLAKELPKNSLISIDGDTLVINEIKSKYYLVDFWYRSCYPCIKAMQVLKQLEAKYSNSELYIISINPIDKNYDSVREFINSNSIPYQVYMSNVSSGRKFKGIYSYPSFILYDTDFKVVLAFSGYTDDLMQRIEKMMVD